jgi:hypothetical protein
VYRIVSDAVSFAARKHPMEDLGVMVVGDFGVDEYVALTNRSVTYSEFLSLMNAPKDEFREQSAAAAKTYTVRASVRVCERQRRGAFEGWMKWDGWLALLLCIHVCSFTFLCPLFV